MLSRRQILLLHLLMSLRAFAETTLHGDVLTDSGPPS